MEKQETQKEKQEIQGESQRETQRDLKEEPQEITSTRKAMMLYEMVNGNAVNDQMDYLWDMLKVDIIQGVGNALDHSDDARIEIIARAEHLLNHLKGVERID